jgi:hypothetical protein
MDATLVSSRDGGNLVMRGLHCHIERRLLLAVMALALPALAGASVSCVSKGCPNSNCQNQFAATVTAASASLPSGIHRIDVTADGMMLSCTFAFPLETPPSAGTTSPECSFGLTAFVGPAVTCTAFENGGAKGLRCDPIPDQFQESLQIAGTPALVNVEQSVGGAVILQRSATPVYRDNMPNGPGCEPTCRQASAAWSIP